ncbi:hypothetical protein BDZ91DRAFT_721758 [Kalaharituber pfeilii]|nr:hypothetical protein BDZ91DRAFT_721758 [Kalaharituber pfeilii]
MAQGEIALTFSRETTLNYALTGAAPPVDTGSNLAHSSTSPEDRLSALPDEILLAILSYLDISDLFSLIKTSHHLRNISLDPLLHRKRLRSVKSYLSLILPKRPPIEALKAPRRIYLSHRDFARKELNRGLTKIKLNKKLEKRPDPGWLVERGVLPAKYLKKWRVAVADGEDKGQTLLSSTSDSVVLERERNTSASDIPFIAAEKSTYSCPTSQGPSSPNTTASCSETSLPQQQPSKQPQVSFHYYYTPTVSPTILSTCLTLEKQLLRDRLCEFVRNKRASLEQAAAKHYQPPYLDDEDDRHPSAPSLNSISKSNSCEGPSALTPTRETLIATSAIVLRRPSVRYLVSRFSFRFQDGDKFAEEESRWGRGAEWRRKMRRERRERVGEEIDQPCRVRVVGLRRFYEKLAKEATGSGGVGGNGSMEVCRKRQAGLGAESSSRAC